MRVVGSFVLCYSERLLFTNAEKLVMLTVVPQPIKPILWL